MKLRCIALLIFLLSGINLLARAAASEKNGHASLCSITENPEEFENKVVSIDIKAQAALHQFDVLLTDDACPKRGMFLRVGTRFSANMVFLAFMRKLYPRFPDDDGYTDDLVEARVKGKVVRVENRGLLMTYLELEEIDNVR